MRVAANPAHDRVHIDGRGNAVPEGKHPRGVARGKGKVQGVDGAVQPGGVETQNGARRAKHDRGDGVSGKPGQG